VYRAIAEIVASGQYGRPLTTIFRDDQYFPIQGFYGSTWRADVTKAGGGTLIEHSIHDVDLVRMIFGDPAEVQARTNTRFGHPGIEDLASLLLTYADGSTLSLISVWHQILSRESTRRVEVFLEDALLTTSDDYLGPLVIETVDGEESRLAPPPVWMDRFELPEVYAKPLAQYAEASKAFLDGLAADSAYHGSPDVEDALGAHRLVDLAYRSAASGGVALAR
jgi:predicted dehydrogenase